MKSADSWRNRQLTMLVTSMTAVAAALVPPSVFGQVLSRDGSTKPESAVETETSGKPLDLVLQIQWQSPSGARLAGEISIDTGRFAEPRNMSLHAGSTGGLWLEDEQRKIRIQPRAQGRMGGVQLQVLGREDSNLKISLQSRDSSPETLHVRLSELVGAFKKFPLNKGTLSLRRVGGDQLRVKFDAPSMIFDAGQTVPVGIAPNGRFGIRSSELQIVMELHRARQGGLVWSHQLATTSDEEGAIPKALQSLPLPATEGVYDLLVTLQQSSRFGRAKVLASSTTQLVVLEKSSPATEASVWKSLTKLQLTNPKESSLGWIKERLPQWLPGANASDEEGPWASVAPKSVQILAESAIELPAQAWYAIRLKDLPLGKPHQVIIKVPSDLPARLQATIVESDAAGTLPTLQVDTALVLPRPIRPVPLEWVEHPITFWPKSSNPVLMLTNHNVQNSVIVGPIEVRGGVEHLPHLAPTGEAESGPPTRFAALHLEKPTLPEAFGASLALDSLSNTPLHDWVTFYESAIRLADYLKFVGYGGAFATIASDGSTLYPTEKFSSTPRYDTGMFFSNGQDPMQKDVVELLLRILDRQQLRLVAVVDIGSPLTSLERQLSQADKATGIEAVNSEGQRHADLFASPQGQAVYYNATDARVQDEISATIRELVRRYKHHSAFAGVAIQLGNHRFVQLPEAEWTADPVTVAAFTKELAAKLPPGVTPQQWVADAGRFEFLQWRSRRLTALYTELGQRLSDVPVYLIGADTTESGSGNTDPCLEVGINWELLGPQANVIPLRLYRSRPLGTIPQMLRDASLDTFSQWDRQLDALPAAGVTINTPLEYVSKNLAQPSGPWSDQEAPPFLLTHAVVGGSSGTMRLAASLQANDRWPMLLGGWSPPRGTEALTARWLNVYQHLPAQRFENVPRVPPIPDQQGTSIVRRLKTADAFYAYLFNPAPWTSRIRLQWHNPDGAPAKWLGEVPASSSLGKEGLQAILLPGALLAVKIDSAEADISNWTENPLAEESVPQVVAERLRDLSLLAAHEHFAPMATPLLNGDFETSGDEIPGWMWSQHPATSVSLDSTSAAKGKYSLRLESHADADGPRAWVISQPLPQPTTGRLAVAAKIRVERDLPIPNFRIAIEGRLRGKSIRQAVSVGKPEAGPLPKDDWSGAPYRVEMIDLPAEGVEDLRVAFDLVGSGVVWIDDVQVSTSFINARERAVMQEEIYMAVEHLKNQNLTSAATLLTTSWARRLLSVGLPLAEKPVVEKPAEDPTTPVSTAEKIRLWLPRMLR